MAVEIKEIVIKAVLTETDAGKSGSSSFNGNTDGESLVQECVDQVLKVLNRKKRR